MKKSINPISNTSFLARLKSRALDAFLFSLFSILFIGGIVYALTYASAPPQGETAGGKFMLYFNKMLVNTGATTDGTVKKSE